MRERQTVRPKESRRKSAKQRDKLTTAIMQRGGEIEDQGNEWRDDDVCHHLHIITSRLTLLSLAEKATTGALRQ